MLREEETVLSNRPSPSLRRPSPVYTLLSRGQIHFDEVIGRQDLEIRYWMCFNLNRLPVGYRGVHSAIMIVRDIPQIIIPIPKELGDSHDAPRIKALR